MCCGLLLRSYRLTFVGNVLHPGQGLPTVNMSLGKNVLGTVWNVSSTMTCAISVVKFAVRIVTAGSNPIKAGLPYSFAQDTGSHHSGGSVIVLLRAPPRQTNA